MTKDIIALRVYVNLVDLLIQIRVQQRLGGESECIVV